MRAVGSLRVGGVFVYKFPVFKGKNVAVCGCENVDIAGALSLQGSIRRGCHEIRIFVPSLACRRTACRQMLTDLQLRPSFHRTAPIELSIGGILSGSVDR